MTKQPQVLKFLEDRRKSLLVEIEQQVLRQASTSSAQDVANGAEKRQAQVEGLVSRLGWIVADIELIQAGEIEPLERHWATMKVLHLVREQAELPTNNEQ